MYIPRLRKINQAIKEIKSLDNKTELTEYLLIQLIKNKNLTSLKYGNAWLINLDELYKFFKTKDNNKWKNLHQAKYIELF